MKNGLYSVRIEMLDGVRGENTGVMMLRDGQILGGDSFFYYVGSYSFADGKWRGEILNREHTKTLGERPLFGNKDVSIGFSGTYNEAGAEASATALAGKRSIRFRAMMRLLTEA
jgi:T3SS negative regulator,GrlR